MGQASQISPAFGSKAEVRLTFDPPGPTFYIGRDARMPVIRATATVKGVEPRVMAIATYSWTVTVVMQNAKVPLAEGRQLAHPRIQQVTLAPSLVLPFTKVRGGELTVSVKVQLPGLAEGPGKQVKGPALEATSRGLNILGTNPTEGDLIAAGASDLMLKIIRHESSLRQFSQGGPAVGYPLFSQDKQGGVGLTQLTNPRPEDDEIWSWKLNLSGGMRVLKDKTRVARDYLSTYPGSGEFQDLVKAYNVQRARAAAVPQAGAPPGPVKPPVDLKITLQGAGDDQITREALRAYNGYGPPFPAHTRKYVREFVALVDARNVLIVDLGADGVSGQARWHEITGEERKRIWQNERILKTTRKGDPIYPGDPDYVAAVLGITIADPAPSTAQHAAPPGSPGVMSGGPSAQK